MQHFSHTHLITQLFLLHISDKLILVQNPEILHQPVQYRLCILSEFSFYKPGYFINCSFPIHLLPHKAAILVQHNMTYPGSLEQFLRQPVIKAFIYNMDSDNSFFIRIPCIKRVTAWNKVHKVFLFFHSNNHALPLFCEFMLFCSYEHKTSTKKVPVTQMQQYQRYFPHLHSVMQESDSVKIHQAHRPRFLFPESE